MITLKINELLTKKGKSCYWLAKQCDISQNNMAKICNGETSSMRFDTLEKICLALDCTPNELIDSDNPRMDSKISRMLMYQHALLNIPDKDNSLITFDDNKSDV